MRYLIILLVLLNGFTGFGQSRLDSAFKSTESMGYISAKQGFGNLSDLLFEGMIKNKFYISFPGEGNWAISFEPAMNVRMLMEHSFPVINPSYHAIGDVLYRLPSSKQSMSFINFRIGHHSNGQADLFWNYIDNVIDFEDGNFMTNYLSFGWNNLRERKYGKYNVLVRRKLELEVHPNVFRNPFLDEMYDDIRLNGTHVIRLERENKRPSMMLETEATLLCEQIGVRRVVNGEAIIARLRYSIQPIRSTDFWLYTELYHGQDYYNMYFNDILNVWRFGVLAVPQGKPIFH